MACLGPRDVGFVALRSPERTDHIWPKKPPNFAFFTRPITAEEMNYGIFSI